MLVGYLRLMLAGLWLAVGVVVLLREPLGLAAVDRVAGANGTVMGAVAVGLGCWNAARWWSTRRPPAYTVIRPRDEPEPERPYEYHPEFDFTRPADERKP